MEQTIVGELEKEIFSLRDSGGLTDKIEKARLELLDLSTRNRLLHTPRGGRAKTVEVVHELAAAMYQTLVQDGKRVTFAPGKEDPKQSDALDSLDDEGDASEDRLASVRNDPDLVDQPDFELDENGRVKAQWDERLTTRLTSVGLQKRLLDLYIDAKTLQEEQGVNVLYLAIGYLRWRAASTPQVDRFAPLVLIPVQLERGTAGEKFHLKWTGDDVDPNLSLQLFLHREFGLRLPNIGDFETLDINAYMGAVEAMIAGRPDWSVLQNDAILGLFSFAKFMMYRDLDPAGWKSVGGMESISMLRGVVSDGFPGATLTDENSSLDALIAPEKMRYVVDCDSSQALVVHDVLQGKNILVQGPPGTGKSQTIANIISAAVAENKRVLFVAEKMAALEVVKRRLDHVGVGVACLELHSNKANKRSLLEELRQTLNLGDPKRNGTAPIIEQLKEKRELLNAHAERLHHPLFPAELTPYQVFGHLVRLRRQGYVTESLPIDSPVSWAPHEKEARAALLRELIERIEVIGVPNEHAWSGVQNDGLLPNERDRLIEMVKDLSMRLEQWTQDATTLHRTLDLAIPARLVDVELAVQRAQALVEAPAVGPEAFQSAVWDDQEQGSGVIDALEAAQQATIAIAGTANEQALEVNWDSTRATLIDLTPLFVLGAEIATLALVHDRLTRLTPDLTRLAQLLAEEKPLTLDLAFRLTAIAERATTIPELDRDALVAHIWERGVDAVEDLVTTVEKLQQAKLQLSTVFRDAAWSKDAAELEAARSQLFMSGTNVFRILNAQWRRANQLVRALLSNPKLQRTEMLAALDILIDAKAWLRKIGENDAQGLEAFGSNWQRERSNTSFLHGVVAWMRTLHPLGNGVRERLADIGDRVLATEIAKRVRPGLGQILKDLTPIHEALLAIERNPWGEEIILQRVPITVISAKSACWRSAHEQTALLTNSAELTVEQALNSIEKVQHAQQARNALATAALQGAPAFGPFWKGISSTASELRSIAKWMSENSDLRQLAAKLTAPQVLLTRAEQASAMSNELAAQVAEVMGSLQFEGSAELASDMSHAPLPSLISQLKSWQDTPEGLRAWVAYLALANDAKRKGLDEFVKGLSSGELATSHALGVFELSYFEAVLQALSLIHI